MAAGHQTSNPTRKRGSTRVNTSIMSNKRAAGRSIRAGIDDVRRLAVEDNRGTMGSPAYADGDNRVTIWSPIAVEDNRGTIFFKPILSVYVRSQYKP
jgi:hypothetical protein